MVREKLQVAPPVAENVFTRKPLNNIGFSIGQVLVLVEYSYNAVDIVLYWKFRNILEWCELKEYIPVIRGGSTFGDINIKFLQSLVSWETDSMPRGKYIDLNYFNGDIISDTIM